MKRVLNHLNLNNGANRFTSISINKPTAIKINQDFGSDRCVLTELSLSAATFEIDLHSQIPRLVKFYDVPLKFVLPGTQLGISCLVDIDRVYVSGNNSKHPVYGMVARFKMFGKEDRQKLKDYLGGRE